VHESCIVIHGALEREIAHEHACLLFGLTPEASVSRPPIERRVGAFPVGGVRRCYESVLFSNHDAVCTLRGAPWPHGCLTCVLVRKLSMHIHAGSKLRLAGFAESCLRAIFCEWFEHAFALLVASAFWWPVIASLLLWRQGGFHYSHTFPGFTEERLADHAESRHLHIFA